MFVANPNLPGCGMVNPENGFWHLIVIRSIFYIVEASYLIQFSPTDIEQVAFVYFVFQAPVRHDGNCGLSQ